MDSDRKSVRVEIEESTQRAHDVPELIGPQRDNKSAALLGFVLVAAALVGLLLVIRPDDSSTADGSPRQTPTPAPAVTTTTARETSEARFSVVGVSVDETTGAARLAEAVADDVGFLGVGFGDRDGAPVILRSVDGAAWEEVEALVRGVTEVPRHDGFRNFESLIRTETGFAVLLLDTSYIFAEAGGAQQETTRMIRLTTERGALWSVDPTFPIIEVEGIPSIFGHDEQHFGYVDYDRGRNIELRHLLEASLIDDQPLEDLCSASRTRSGSASALRLLQCASGVEIVIDGGDLVQPELAESIFSCATALVELRGAPQRSVLVQRGAEPVGVGRLGTPAGPPVLLPGGEVAALSAPLPDSDIAGRCDGLVDGPPTEPAIEHWIDGELAARFTIPEHVALATDLFSARAPGVAHEEGLRLSLGGAIWDVSLDDGSWTRAVDLVGPDDGQFLSLGGVDQSAVLLGNNELSIWRGGDLRWLTFPLGRQMTGPTVLYNRDNIVLVRDGDDPLVIRLSP